jgi:hypothetical protein
MPVHLGSMDRSVRNRHQAQRRQDHPPATSSRSTRPTMAAPTCPTSPSSRRSSTTTARRSCSGRPRAATTPTSAASAPGSMTPLATTVDEEGVLIDNFKLVDQGRFREEALVELLTDHPYPCRNPSPERRRPEGADRRQREGREGTAQDGRHFGLDVVQAYMGHVQDNAEESVRRVIEALADSEYEYPTDQGAVIKVKITVDKRQREATVDFTGTSEVQAEQLQRAGTGDARRGALLLPRDGGRPHPDERGLPEADQHRHPGRLHAQADLSGSRRRRQRGNEPACHQRALRRAEGDGGQPGDDEQPDLRQRHLSVLRDASARARPRAPASTARTACTST